MTKDKWYSDGLTFECQGCGNCCSGPEEGYVWINKREIEAMAAQLQITAKEFKDTYCRRVALKYSLKEKSPSHDCLFLEKRPEGGMGCELYQVRPLQCRTWPFWKTNLANKRSWDEAAEDCPGMNRGRLFSRSEIEAVRDGDLSPLRPSKPVSDQAIEWAKNNLDNKAVIESVFDVYADIDRYIESAAPKCENCGLCCNFGKYGHRLYATTAEMTVFYNFAREVKPSEDCDTDKCIYRGRNRCDMYQGRTSGCRIFYCQDLPDELQNELYEQVLARLRDIHLQLKIPYYYADLMWWLENYKNI